MLYYFNQFVSHASPSKCHDCHGHFEQSKNHFKMAPKILNTHWLIKKKFQLPDENFCGLWCSAQQPDEIIFSSGASRTNGSHAVSVTAVSFLDWTWSGSKLKFRIILFEYLQRIQIIHLPSEIRRGYAQELAQACTQALAWSLGITAVRGITHGPDLRGGACVVLHCDEWANWALDVWTLNVSLIVVIMVTLRDMVGSKSGRSKIKEMQVMEMKSRLSRMKMRWGRCSDGFGNCSDFGVWEKQLGFY